METTHQKIRTTPKDFFLHLGVMVALYATSISLISLLYGIINYYFPDQYAYDYSFTGSVSSINGSIAALFVLFPTFLILARTAEKDMRSHPEKRELWIRKWLIYLTLFVAGVTMAVDFIFLIQYFLEGDVTTRFLIKVITVFLTTGAIFCYFMYDLKRNIHKNKSMLALFVAVASFIVIATLGLSFSIIGSPLEQRNFKLDETRVQQLSDLTQQVIYYRQTFGKVPEQLTDLAKNGYNEPRDPKTGNQYEFKRISNMKFELCATFERETRPLDVGARDGMTRPLMPGIAHGYVWKHTMGKTCFEREIFPDQISEKPGMPIEKFHPAPAI